MLIKSLISCQTSCKENLIQEKVAFARHNILGKEIHVLYSEGRHIGGGTQGRISMLFFQYFVWGLVTIMLARQCQDSLYFGRLKALPPICLPSVYLTPSHVWLYLPGFPSPLLHNASDPKLELGKAWEQGYVITMYRALLLTLILFPDWGCCWRFRNLIITSSNSLLCCYIPFPSLPLYPTISFILFTSCLIFPSLLSLHFPPTFFPLSHFLTFSLLLSAVGSQVFLYMHILLFTQNSSSRRCWSVMNPPLQTKVPDQWWVHCFNCWCVERFCTQYFVEFAVSAWLVCTLLTFAFFYMNCSPQRLQQHVFIPVGAWWGFNLLQERWNLPVRLCTNNH